MIDLILPRIARNEPDAMERFIERYEGLVRSLVATVHRNRADAEDAVQSIFIDLWRSAGRFDPERGSEATFVSIVTRRRLADWRRSAARRRAPEPMNECEALLLAAAAAAEVAEEARRASESVAQLSHGERLVLGLSIDRGLAHSDVARATGLPLGTVKTHVRRGLLKLRAMVESADDGRHRPRKGEAGDTGCDPQGAGRMGPATELAGRRAERTA